MFCDALEIVNNFTFPVIISSRTISGKVNCGCGAFIVINDEGWIITVKHLWDTLVKFQTHIPLIEEYNQKKNKILADSSINQKIKGKRINKIPRDPEWITNQSYWWSKDEYKAAETKFLEDVDLAVVRIEPFDKNMVKRYPTFKNPTKMKVGRSLCKIGYPFHEIKASYDEHKNRFIIADGVLPLPRFPIEGIYTRNLRDISSKNPDVIKYLETSSPGLRGQSGGPIFDLDGNIWAIQSHTNSLPLGFAPEIKQNGKKITEYQIINIGVGVHGKVIVKFLEDNGIKFNISDL